MSNINDILNDYIKKLKIIEEKIEIINEEGNRLMESLKDQNDNIYGQIGDSPVGVEEPIINENNAIMIENRLTDVAKAALKLADMKDKIISEVRRFHEDSVRHRSLSISQTRRSRRNSTGRGVKKSKRNNKKSKK
jgi:hypothetical protein